MRASWLFFLAACVPDDIPLPHISSIAPETASPGVPVDIRGTGFCQQPIDVEADPFACNLVGFVVFGSSQASTIQYQDEQIQAEVPELEPGVVEVGVHVGGHASNTFDFTIE
jgi:IPT/TIG domain